MSRAGTAGHYWPRCRRCCCGLRCAIRSKAACRCTCCWSFNAVRCRLGGTAAGAGLRIAWLPWLDWRGWTGATLTSLVAAAWMLPSLLDLSLMSPVAAAAKYASWWLAGWLLADSWRRLDPEVLLFLVGNIAWMFATAGLLYLDTPQQLCVNYLRDDQRHAGIGMVLLAICLAALAIRRALTADRRPVPRNPSDRALRRSPHAQA